MKAVFLHAFYEILSITASELYVIKDILIDDAYIMMLYWNARSNKQLQHVV